MGTLVLFGTVQFSDRVNILFLPLFVLFFGLKTGTEPHIAVEKKETLKFLPSSFVSF